jgi:hypothetical protein
MKFNFFRKKSNVECIKCGKKFKDEIELTDQYRTAHAGILIIIVLLALLGLGWDTFVSGVKKGADKVGITPILQRAVEIVENGTRNLVSNL